MYSDQDFVRLGRRRRQLSQLEDLRRAVALHDRCFHEGIHMLVDITPGCCNDPLLKQPNSSAKHHASRSQRL
ncbi:MAG TPA: hypothetical protein VFB99_15290, partial [Vicinamibacterales bacterium]|nr:hypothetical protein [Vicinamibacterales bacterium]